MMLFKAFAAAALVVVSLSASADPANPTNWGTHDPIEFGSGSATGAGSLIDDIFKFSLTNPAGLMSVSVTNDGANGVFDLQNAMVTLYKVGDSTAIGSFSFDSTAVSYTWSSLAAGDYYYEVTAQVASTASAGTYQLSSTLMPVPEPETYALMLGGLGVIGFVAGRRRKV